MARTITPFKLRTELIADTAKHTSSYKKAEGEVTQYTNHLTKEGKRAAKAFDGAGAGAKFGKDFGVSAIASLGDSFNVSTLGSLIGTAVAPGIGTAIGSAVGGGIDKALSTVTPIVLNTIDRGMRLNKLIEETRVEYVRFTGSEKEANKYVKELLDMSRDLGILPATIIDTSEKLYDLTGDLKLTRSILKAATDQAADFGGEGTFEKVAETLGLIAERGEISTRELQKLFRVGVNAKKLLAEATGLQESQITKLMGQGRIRGDVAARLISEGIEREVGGFAAHRTASTVAGRERQFNVLQELRAADATANITEAQGRFYGKANAILDSSQAKYYTDFFNKAVGQVIDLTEKGVAAGVSLGGGFAQGLMDGNSLTSLMGSFTKLKDWTGSALNSVFEIKSPSQWSAREVGEPLGEGIGVGLVRRFKGFMQGEGADKMRDTLEQLLKDPKILALLRTIEWAEGGAENIIVGGKRTSDLSRHPNKVGLVTSAGPSTAAGSYQITGSNWYGKKGRPGLRDRLNLPDFTLHSQQLAALQIIVDRMGSISAVQSASIDKLRNVAALDWTSTPGSTIGGGGQRSMKSWMGHFNQFIGAPYTPANPLPVVVMRAPRGGSLITSRELNRLSDFTASNLANFKRGNDGASMPDLIGGSSSELDRTVATIQDGGEAIVNITDATRDLITTTAQMVPNNALILQTLPPVLKAEWELAQARAAHASSAIALTKNYQQAARDELIVGMSVIDRVQGMLAQVTGMIPSQEVGKKRGLLSKILGFAAPFLSFIPGVGGILSTIVGAAGNIAGGNYGAAVTGIAGGFATGGVFRPRPQVRTPNTVPGRAGRAYGGPVYAGRSYIVGEHRREVFEPTQDGYVHPSVDQYARTRGGGGGGDIWERLTRSLERMESMSPDDVVRFGARGLNQAMDRDASLAESYGRRLNLGRG